jgi:amidohydrolase
MNFFDEADALFDYSRDLRRDLHQHPELAFQEVRTAKIVAQELGKIGLEVRTGVGKTGVVGILEGERPGPVILLRFDMDALPIEEATGAPYTSKTPGVMHACGHDGHTTIGLTVARLLQGHAADLPGTIKFMFQPAEEWVAGAKAMIADGVLDEPRPAMALGLHLWNYEPIGWFGVTPGPAMAAVNSFEVEVTGLGGHAALPEKTHDPIVAAAQIITALQTVVSRNVSPLESAVVSITEVRSGDSTNVIPPVASLKGTIRSYLPEVQDLLGSRVKEIVCGIGKTLQCDTRFEVLMEAPPLKNDLKITSSIQDLIRRAFPGKKLDTSFQTMGSEDMAEVLVRVPGCYFFVGSADPDRGLNAPHHHPEFDFDEKVLPLAAGLMATAAKEQLESN